MRFKSAKVGGFQVFAVAGTNTISFGIDFEQAAIAGLMGFAVERQDVTENERYYMFGFKVFLAPLAMALFIMVLEILVAFIQAFIFALLASVFIGQIRSVHH